MAMTLTNFLTLVLLLESGIPSQSFTASSSLSPRNLALNKAIHGSSPLYAADGATAVEEEEEISSILRPSYPIEPIPLRIGHGFDIHRMVPFEEAGQPVVIGGVVIDHEDQKVCSIESFIILSPSFVQNFGIRCTILFHFIFVFLFSSKYVFFCVNAIHDCFVHLSQITSNNLLGLLE